jgi:hypothetical protein
MGLDIKPIKNFNLGIFFFWVCLMKIDEVCDEMKNERKR